jgi:glycine/D-amino acid oxidase-like deaminating enzyme
MRKEKERRIVGQGLAGTCLGLELLKREVPFRIIDPGEGGSSRVAAGLINPLTGKRFQPSWMIEDFHPAALDFYHEIEQRLGEQLWHPLPVMRLASSEKEWMKISAKLELPETQAWLDPESKAPTPPGFAEHVVLKGGGWLDTRRFLEVTRDHFERQGVLEVGTDEGQPITEERILCEGAQGLVRNQLGKHRCAKGEILTVLADWPEDHIKIGAGGWLIPIGNGRFRIGSTYEWEQLDGLPTTRGMERISEIISKLGGPEYKIVDHVAGIRPILRRSQPLIGKTPEGHWFFNALGSKGTLYAPKMSKILADWIYEGVVPDQEFTVTVSDIDS